MESSSAVNKKPDKISEKSDSLDKLIPEQRQIKREISNLSTMMLKDSTVKHKRVNTDAKIAASYELAKKKMKHSHHAQSFQKAALGRNIEVNAKLKSNIGRSKEL